MSHRSERGSVSVLVVVLGAVILLLAALVYDEGEILTARSRALAAAGEAARAGSRALTPSIREGGVPSVDPGEAAAAATAFLDPLGYRASVSISMDGDQAGSGASFFLCLLFCLSLDDYRTPWPHIMN